MSLPIARPFPPMEAEPGDRLPEGEGWLFEPKWDGFRCLVFRDGDTVELQSKAGETLTRYFPELVAAMGEVGARRFVLDGEIVIPRDGTLSFDDLLQRIHPAESRVRTLAASHPALFIAFDLLVDERGRDLTRQPLVERRARLEAFVRARFRDPERMRLSPSCETPGDAERWFRAAGGALDGVMAKRRDAPYLSGERTGMRKIKRVHSADCVVGGFRYASREKVVGSLLLGLYDDNGLLHHVGFTSSFKAEERRALTSKLEALVKPPGFTGRAPGGPSRWSTRRSSEWEPLAPKLVVEVQYDHVSGGRFRHGTKLLRWRPDKAPKQCTMDQVKRGRGSLVSLLEGVAAKPPRARAVSARTTRAGSPRTAARDTAAARARPSRARRPATSRRRS